MVEFNTDGSLKLPARMTRQKTEDDDVFSTKPSFKIVRQQISTVTPLMCEVTIEPSKLIANPDIVVSAFNEASANFKNESELSIVKREDGYTVKIVS
jgi:hypothetical protein